MRPTNCYCGKLFAVFGLMILTCGKLVATGLPALPILQLPDSLADSSALVKVEYYSNKGYAMSFQSPDSALLYFKQGEIEARNSQDSAAILKSCFNMGHFLMARGIYEQALEYMYSGEILSAAVHDTSKHIFFLYWKSRVYNELGEYEKSIEACEEAAKFSKQGKGHGWPLNYYGEALRGAGRLNEARDSLELAYKIFQEEGERIGLLMVAAKLAHVYEELNLPEMVRKYANLVLDKWEGAMAYESYLTAITSMIRVELARGNADSAEVMALRALQTVEGKRYYRPTIQLAELLGGIFEQKGNYKETLKYYRMARSLEDNYELDKVKINLAVKESEYLNERLQEHNEHLREQKKGQFYLTLTMACLLVLFAGIAILLVLSFRKSRDFNRILQKKNSSLDSLNQEKDMLMQIVAHDLKSPLNTVMSLGQMLQMLGPVNDSQKTVLEKMDFVVKRGIDLIKNLLELAAVEDGKLELHSVDSELRESLQKIIADYKMSAENKSIALHLELPTEPILLKTDPGYYERIVDNLVSNAIKYSPKGKSVWIELKKRENQIQTVVRDEGPGIGEEDQKKLFGKFQRLSARPTAGESSNGLGLAIVKAFAEQLGGEIKVKSSLGQGAEFTLILPLAG
ncbi:MAG: hypothetical protein H6581_25650 [Bacteroidia bacterium]|nr:hypothetical protein [Bacteroidia bacterium]